MKNLLPLIVLASLVLGQLCVAQTNQPADDWKPATSNQRGKQYPQVNSERRVRAHVVAPQAQSNVTTEGDRTTFMLNLPSQAPGPIAIVVCLEVKT